MRVLSPVKKSKTLKQLYGTPRFVDSRRWMSGAATSDSEMSRSSRRAREEQLEGEMALNHPDVLALSKIKQHKPSRALEILKKPLDELTALKDLNEAQTQRLHHLLGIRLHALVEMNELRDAAAVATRQIDLLPRNPLGLSNRGFVQAAAGDYYSAASSQREAIELAQEEKPNSVFIEGHFRLAIALRNLSDLQGALDTIEIILDNAPTHYDAMILKSSIYLEMGRVEESRETLLESVRLDGTRPEAYAELGNLLYSNSQFEAATKFLKEALARDPHNVDALVYMGNVLVMTKLLQEAMTAYDSALLHDSKNIKALLAKAALLGRTKKYDEAIRTVDSVIARNSNIAQAYLTKGEAYEQLGKSDEALQSFQRALDVDPKFRRAYLAQFKLLHKIGRIEQLEEAANKAIQYIPEFAEAYLNLGLASTMLRRLKEARVHFEKALAVAPTSTSAALSLVSCLTQLGELEEAFSVLERSSKLDRKSSTYNMVLANLLQVSSRLDEAVEAVNRALVSEPNSVSIHQMKASLLQRLGRYDECHDVYDYLISASPNPGRAHLQKGHVYMAQKNYVFAIDCFNTAVEIDALLSPVALRSKILPLTQLGRLEEVEEAKATLERLNVNNPKNQKEAEPQLTYRPVENTREEVTEEDDEAALLNELGKSRRR